MTLTFRMLTAVRTPKVWTCLRARNQSRRALAALLAKDDDHLIEDIGLTRAEVERLQRFPVSGR